MRVLTLFLEVKMGFHHTLYRSPGGNPIRDCSESDVISLIAKSSRLFAAIEHGLLHEGLS